MQCGNPSKRKCDECGAVVSEWCEYEFGDVCLACDANEANESETAKGEPEGEGLPQVEAERQADERDAEALVRFFRAMLPKRHAELLRT